MEVIPAHLLAAANPSFAHHVRPADEHMYGIETTEVNQLATHLPDFILNMNFNVKPPFVRHHSGVVMFLDISGFTDLSEKCSVNRGSGSDQLTAILNDYMGSMIDQVMRIGGDVLKFAGDAILVFWKIKDYDHLLMLTKKVIKCSVDIQAKYGSYNADGLTTLKVKIALSLGRMYFHVFGHDKRYFFCESGNAVKDAKDAESLSKSGDVIVSPYFWSFCEEKEYDFKLLPDLKHVKVTNVLSGAQKDDLFGFGKSLDRPVTSGGDGHHLSSVDITINGDDAHTVIRKSVFRVHNGMNDILSKYVTETVLDKLNAGHGIEYHSEIRPCTVAFVNVELTKTNLKAYLQCEILQKSYELIYQELEHYKASLNKAIMFDKGCSFLIIFGLPGRKDTYDCKHAVQCAWKIRQKLQDMKEVSVASVGVTTGYTFCGVVGHEHRHEYTVIGRIVNMAARLMIHYPGIVSCDNETFTRSKLRQHHFRDVPAKELKGLKNVGVIREYTEDASNICYIAPSLPTYAYPMAGNRSELALFKEKLHSLTEAMHEGLADGHEIYKNILIYEGTQDTGVTRLLASIADEVQEECHVVVASLASNDINRPHFVIRTIIGVLLELDYESSEGTSRSDALREILQKSKEFTRKEISSVMKVVEVVLLLADDKFLDQLPDQVDHEMNELLFPILHNLISIVMKKSGKMVVIVIDDADYMDIISWSFIKFLAGRHGLLCVLGMFTLEKTVPSDMIQSVISDDFVTRVKVEPLAEHLQSVVACQMMAISAIPIELEQLLCERSQGMPGYIKHILLDLLVTNRLKIVSLLHYHSAYDDFVWPEYELIAGRKSEVSRKKSMLRTRNKWAFQELAIEERDSAEHRICIVTPGTQLIPALYKTPDSLKSELLTEFDQISPTEQMTLKCASVIGVACCTDFLRMLWPLPPATLNAALETLFNKDYLRCYSATKMRNRADSFNVCDCDMNNMGPAACQIVIFSNFMMRDSVYYILLEDQRTDMHYKVARYIENTAPTLDEQKGAERMDQEMSFLADDVDNIFQECSVKRLTHYPDITGTAVNCSLYGRLRQINCLNSYVASENSSFCSQKSLDFLSDRVPETPVEEVKKISSTDELLQKVVGNLSSQQEKKKKDVDKHAMRAKAKGKLSHKHRKQRDTLLDGLAGFTPVGSFTAKGGMKELVSSGGMRRRAGSQGSVMGEGEASIFSLAFNGGKCDLDHLQSRRESVSKYAERMRPSIGKSSLDIQMKLSLFRQAIWHWKCALHLRNTLLSLVEAGCVAMQYQLYREAFKFLGYAKALLGHVQEEINPINGEHLTEIEDQKIKDFWRDQSAKVSTLLGQLLFIVGEKNLATSYYAEGLQELKFCLPHTKLSSLLSTIKLSLPRQFQCLPRKKTASPTELGHHAEICRLLSSVYIIGAQTETKLTKLMLLSCIRSAEVSEDSFELLIAYAHYLLHLQAEGRFKFAGQFINKVNAKQWESPFTDEIHAAKHYFCYSSLLCYLCQGHISNAADELTRMEELNISHQLSYLSTPIVHQYMLQSSQDAKHRLKLVHSLCHMNDDIFYQCLWEEIIYNNMNIGSVISKEEENDLLSYTDNMLTRVLESVPADSNIVSDLSQQENSTLTSYLFYLTCTNGFLSTELMEKALLTLQSLQPEDISSYISAWSYYKVIASILSSLAQARHPNVMCDAAEKMLKHANLILKSVPVLNSWHKRLIAGLQSWKKLAEITVNLRPYHK